MTTSVPVSPAGYHLMLPPGWSRFSADDAGRKALIMRVSARMKAIGRPDLDVEARTLLEVRWRQLVATKSVAVYMPGERDDEVMMPMSIALKQFVAAPGSSFESAVRAAAAVDVERFDGPYGEIFRWAKNQNGSGELAEVRSRSVGYGFPLPGDAPRRGLLFLTSIPHLPNSDPTLVDALVELSDSIMETFRWR